MVKHKTKYLTIGLVIFLVIFQIQTAPSAPTIEDYIIPYRDDTWTAIENNTTNPNDENSTTTEKVAMSFNLTDWTYVLAFRPYITSVDNTSSTPNITFWIEGRNGTTGKPNGTVFGETFLTSQQASGWVNLTLESPVYLPSGNYSFVIAEANRSDFDNYYLFHHVPDSTTGDNGTFLTYNGTDWEQPSTSGDMPLYIKTTPSDARGAKYLTVEMGSVTSFNWTITESNNDTYLIYVNSTLNKSGSYTSGQNISLETSLFLPSELSAPTTYNITLLANDSLGAESTNLLYATFQDTTNPLIDSPGDIREELYQSIVVEWSASDLQKKNYSILVDDIYVKNDSWTSNTIRYSMTKTSSGGYTQGVYNVTCIVRDASGNTNSDSVQVTVDTIHHNVNYDRGNPNDDDDLPLLNSKILIGIGVITAMVSGVAGVLILYNKSLLKQSRK